jgi:hypothetical protein
MANSVERHCLFKDQGRRLNRLLTNNFPSEKQEYRLEWSGKTSEPVLLETNFVSRKDGSFFGVLKPKMFKKHGNIFTIFSAELSTKKEFKGELTVLNAVTNGTKMTFSVQNNDEELFGTLGADYRHELASFNASVDYGKVKGSNVKASFSSGYEGFLFGGSSDYFIGQTEDSELKELKAAVGYSAKDFDVSVFGRYEGHDHNELGANYYHKLNETMMVGTEFVFDTAHSDKPPHLTFGVKHRFQPDANIKGKFDTNGKIGLSLKQRLGQNSSLIISSTIDMNMSSSKSASMFGLTFATHY